MHIHIGIVIYHSLHGGGGVPQGGAVGGAAVRRGGGLPLRLQAPLPQGEPHTDPFFSL